MLEALLITFPNLHNYIELIPVGIVGILAGIISYLQNTQTCSDKYRNLKHTLKVIVTSSFLTILTYSILTATSLPYLGNVGISAAVGYFGIDRAIELAQKLLNLKGSKNENK